MGDTSTARFDPSQIDIPKMAHDLRNTASAVRAEAQLALMRFEKTGNPSRMKQALENILGQTDQMVNILEERLEGKKHNEE